MHKVSKETRIIDKASERTMSDYPDDHPFRTREFGGFSSAQEQKDAFFLMQQHLQASTGFKSGMAPGAQNQPPEPQGRQKWPRKLKISPRGARDVKNHPQEPQEHQKWPQRPKIRD